MKLAFLLLAVPIVIGQLYSRYFDDAKDARECERKLIFSLKELQAHAVASESNFIACYEYLFGIEKSILGEHVFLDHDFNAITQEFIVRYNNFLGSIEYSQHSPIKLLTFKSRGGEFSFQHICTFIEDQLMPLLSIYISVLSSAKACHLKNDKRDGFETPDPFISVESRSKLSELSHIEYQTEIKKMFRSFHVLVVDSVFD
jgi:hypothetical protein